MDNWGRDCKIVNVLGFVFCINIWEYSAKWFHKAESKTDFSPKKKRKRKRPIFSHLHYILQTNVPAINEVETCSHVPMIQSQLSFHEPAGDLLRTLLRTKVFHGSCTFVFLCEAQGHDRLCLMTGLSSFYRWTDSVGWCSLIGYSEIDMIGRIGDRQDLTENSFFLFAPEWWQWKIIWGIAVRNLKRWEV